MIEVRLRYYVGTRTGDVTIPESFAYWSGRSLLLNTIWLLLFFTIPLLFLLRY